MKISNLFVDILVESGQASYMAKADIESAFRILPISPKDYWLLGFSWEASISCSTFEAVAQSLQFIVHHFKFKGVTNILDDFMFVALSEAKCKQYLCIFTKLMNHLTP
jgi:hypothetical protein